MILRSVGRVIWSVSSCICIVGKKKKRDLAERDSVLLKGQRADLVRELGSRQRGRSRRCVVGGRCRREVVAVVGVGVRCTTWSLLCPC